MRLWGKMRHRPEPGLQFSGRELPLSRIKQSDTLLAVLALIGSMASLCVGTSFAKSLFGAIGAQGTVALRVGFEIGRAHV